MCPPPPPTLNTAPIDNFGGMQWMKSAPVSDLASITLDYYNAPSAIAFQSGKDWYDIYNTFEYIEFKEEDVQSPTGTAYKGEAHGFLPGNAADLILQLEKFLEQRHIIAICDWDNMVTIFGSIENPCKLKISFDTKSKVSGLKGTLITFYRDDMKRSRSVAKSVLF